MKFDVNQFEQVVIRRYSILLIAFLVFVISCRKTELPVTPTPTPSPPKINIISPPDIGFHFVGYFPSYRDPATVPDVKFRMCNIVNYAFATVLATGDITIPNSARLVLVSEKAKSNGAKIFLSFSGSVNNWQQMAASAASRNYFIRQVLSAVRSYRLDGVDIDWEYPSTADGTAQTFSSLMKELGDSCHVDGKYYLSAAITSGKYPGAIRDAISAELLQGSHIDFYNIMAYDDFSTTLPYRHHSDMSLAETALHYWINTRGMPKRRAVLGIPAYGRPSGITQTNTVLTYSAILSQGGKPDSDSAMVTSSGFSPYMIYYNGTITVKRKSAFARSVGNGVMFWEKWQDTHDGTSLMKAACDTLGRPY